MPQFTERAGVPLAYEATQGRGPGVVFLGGYRSDMTGTKALDLEAWCRAEGRAFLRLDYGGHGRSGGAFEDGTIGAWAADAAHVIDHAMPGPHVLVGSSMGGWIALLLARDRPERVRGLVTIAAAPDFTERGFWAGFSDAQRAEVMERGRIEVPSDYEDPYAVTRALIEDGRDRLVLDAPLPLPFPTRFLQGTADAAVPAAWATDLLAHAEGPDMALTLVKGADHRFSEPDALALIRRSVAEVLARAGA